MITLSSLLWVFAISMLPIIELRGAIPTGAALSQNIFIVTLIAILGNILIVLPLLFVLDKGCVFLRKNKLLGKYFDKWFLSVEAKSGIVKKYGYVGLMLFVAVPLPGSGVWSASAISALLEMDKKKSFLAQALGVVIAAIIVAFVVQGILNIPIFAKH